MWIWVAWAMAGPPVTQVCFQEGWRETTQAVVPTWNCREIAASCVQFEEFNQPWLESWAWWAPRLEALYGDADALLQAALESNVPMSGDPSRRAAEKRVIDTAWSCTEVGD